MPRVLAKIGDFLCIPLPDGRFAYGQYVYWHELMATLVSVCDLVTDAPAELDAIAAAGDLFPPVFVGINVPIRCKIWRIVGNRPVVNFTMPLFRCRAGFDVSPGKHNDWLLWDGRDYTPIGPLSPEYQRLEFLLGWSSDALEKRIVTGQYEPYDQMT